MKADGGGVGWGGDEGGFVRVGGEGPCPAEPTLVLLRLHDK